MNKHLRKFLLLLPCLLLHPEGSRAITVDIPAGEVVSGGDVHSVVTQRVYGEADNFTVLGKQQVMSGGVTRNSNIYPYGQQDVLQNGISYGTVVQQYAVQNVDGRAYSSSVGSYGTIDVNAGGYAEDTSVDGGSFLFHREARRRGRLSLQDTNIYQERTIMRKFPAEFRK